MTGAPRGLRIVRRFGPDDAVLAARAIARLKHTVNPPTNDPAAAMKLWLEDSDNILLAAIEQERPVGFALGYLLDRVDEQAKMLFFYEIEVAPTHRRQGIGAALVEAMKRVAEAERVTKMWVQTDPENTAARALYGRADAVPSGSPELIYCWRGERLRQRGS